MIERTNDSDCVIMSAAVADFTLKPSPEKLKRRDGLPQLQFEPSVDVLADLVSQRHEGQVIVGFAAETSNIEENAREKLRSKRVDLLVVNDVAAPGVGFEYETNEVLLVDRTEAVTRVSLRSKEAVSWEILAKVVALLPQGAS
jgi:phosphopantothenoylcysteine decarboxylase/phosphopantothenate--cysteine ligase